MMQDIVLPPGKIGLELESESGGLGLKVRRWTNSIFSLRALPSGSVITAIDGKSVESMIWSDAVVLLRESKRREITFRSKEGSIIPGIATVQNSENRSVNNADNFLNKLSSPVGGNNDENSFWTRKKLSPTRSPLVDRGINVSAAESFFRDTQQTSECSASKHVSFSARDWQKEQREEDDDTRETPVKKNCSLMVSSDSISIGTPLASSPMKVLDQSPSFSQKASPSPKKSQMASPESLSQNTSPEMSSPADTKLLIRKAEMQQLRRAHCSQFPVIFEESVDVDGVKDEEIRALKSDKRGMDAQILLLKFQMSRLQKASVSSKELNTEIDVAATTMNVEASGEKRASCEETVTETSHAETQTETDRETEIETKSTQIHHTADQEWWVLHKTRLSRVLRSISKDYRVTKSSEPLGECSEFVKAPHDVRDVGAQCDLKHALPSSHTASHERLGKKLAVQKRFIRMLKLQLHANVDAQIAMHKHLAEEGEEDSEEERSDEDDEDDKDHEGHIQAFLPPPVIEIPPPVAHVKLQHMLGGSDIDEVSGPTRVEINPEEDIPDTTSTITELSYCGEVDALRRNATDADDGSECGTSSLVDLLGGEDEPVSTGVDVMSTPIPKIISTLKYSTPATAAKMAWSSWKSNEDNGDIGLSPGPLKDHLTQVRDANSMIRADIARFRNMIKKMNS